MGLFQICFCVIILAVMMAYIVAAVNQKRIGNRPLKVIAILTAAIFVAVIAVIYDGDIFVIVSYNDVMATARYGIVLAATYAVAAVVLFVVTRITANIVAMSNQSRK